MSEEITLTIHVPIKGRVLVQFDGSEELTEVATFAQEIPIKVTFPGNGAHPGKIS